MEEVNLWITIARLLFWLIIIWLFREKLSLILHSFADLLKKLKSTTFDFLGLKLETEASLSLGSEDLHNEKFNLYLKAFQSPNVTNEEKVISEQLIQAKLSDNQIITILISQLAHRLVLTKLFLLDRWIYDEQIELLLYLNSNNKTCTTNELEKFYVKWQQKDMKRKKAFADLGEPPPNLKSTSFEEFLSFLIVQNLLTQTMQGFSVSSLGKDYLSFAIKAGRQFPL